MCPLKDHCMWLISWNTCVNTMHSVVWYVILQQNCKTSPFWPCNVLTLGRPGTDLGATWLTNSASSDCCRICAHCSSVNSRGSYWQAALRGYFHSVWAADSLNSGTAWKYKQRGHLKSFTMVLTKEDFPVFKKKQNWMILPALLWYS